ncbi:MAG TPA: aspartyl/asparaginyl beta-hydroxylase domain-containing protein [Dongiaceae bacterium]|nr:aspartyl/asparaginyl beta-hydroxylase domain-containing protein [Dongiaceae bacterium]
MRPREPRPTPSGDAPGALLRSTPWWDTADVPFAARLEREAAAIRTEFGDIVLSGRLQLHPQRHRGPRRALTAGDWNIYTLATEGRLDPRNALEAPVTSALIASCADTTGHPNGLAYFSVLQPHVHVDAHAGPTSTKIRVHLGLVVPPGAEMRVGTETRSWAEGRCLAFDDSWDHEVFNLADRARSVLLVDVWHPDLTPEERRALSAAPEPSPALHFERESWYRDARGDPPAGGDAAALLKTVAHDRRDSLERTANSLRSAPKACRAAGAYVLAVLAGRTIVPAAEHDDAAIWDGLAAIFAASDAARFTAARAVDVVHVQSIAWRADPRHRARIGTSIDDWGHAERKALLDRLVALETPAAMARACAALHFGSAAALLVTALRTVARQGASVAPRTSCGSGAATTPAGSSASSGGSSAKA